MSTIFAESCYNVGTGCKPKAQDDYVFSSAGVSEVSHIGSIRLPDTSFRDVAKEKEDYYLEMAQVKNSDAVFLRSEERTFADTGLSYVISR